MRCSHPNVKHFCSVNFILKSFLSARLCEDINFLVFFKRKHLLEASRRKVRSEVRPRKNREKPENKSWIKNDNLCEQFCLSSRS